MSGKSNSKKNNNNYYYMSFGIGFGLILGAGLGIMIDNIAIGAGVGMLLGITVGTIIDYNKKEK